MKTNSTPHVVPAEPAEDEIRDYAYHLFVQSGSICGRDLDNWLEAKACLCACVPKTESHTRLHRQAQKDKEQKTAAAPLKGIAA